MKKYIKDGVVIVEGTPIQDGDKVYYNPSDAMYKEHGWEEYTEPTPERTLEQAKAQKLQEIEAYDISNNVNGFTVNGIDYWIVKADRVGLMNSTNILKAAGIMTTSLWIGTTEFNVSCDELINILSQIEIYAVNCYCVTEQHKVAVSNMTSISDVDAFDVSIGYPNKLVFNVQ